MTGDLALLAPELVVGATSIVVLFVNPVARAWRRLPTLVASGGLAAALVMVLMSISEKRTIFGGLLAVDSFGSTAKVILLVAAIFVVGMSADYFLSTRRASLAEYYSLMLFSVLGAMLMVGSQNFITFFLALQLTSIPLYILAGFDRLDAKSNEAAVKFLFLGMIASVIMLYGISLVYGLVDTIQFDTLQTALPKAYEARAAIALSVIFILAGFAFKVSAVPFHFWVPDTYEGAPTPATTFLATVPKVAGVAALVRFYFVVLPAPELVWTHQIMAFSALLTMTMGNLLALTQTNIKRMLAYSSVTHIGYMLIALAVGTRMAFSAITFYLVVYILANVCAFAVVLAIARIDRRHLIEGFAGLSSRAPLLAAAMGVSLISMLGIPPTAGFMGKLQIFSSAIDGGLVWLAVAGVANSLVSAVYYVNVLKQMYMTEPAAPERVPVPIGVRAVVVFSMAGIAAIGFFPGPLLDWMYKMTAIAGRFK
ncbi:MAG: NADH-quinone oxidoreductase subunit N [Actinobacteria bacterium]|nr:MAG: NADH-quinone oxidoreductase subunit N [Actinomycetota bacterium]